VGAAALLYITLPLARPPGPDAVLPPAPVRIDNPDQKEFSPRQMLRIPAFWILFAFNVVMRTSGLIMIDFGGSIALAFGMSALLGLLYSPSNGIANITGGILVDKFGTSRVMVMCGISLLVGAGMMLFGNMIDNGIVVIAGLLVAGLSYGCCIVQNAASMRYLFGPKSYAQNFSYVQVSILFAAVGGYLAGSLLDRQEGNFSGVFTLLLCFAVTGIAAGLFMGAYMKKRRAV
jgi:MFS family permease